EVVDLRVAHVLERLGAQRRAAARRAVEDHRLVPGEILVVVGRLSGSARNSSMPRETCTAPATLPLRSTSGVSRTSTTSALPLAIVPRAGGGLPGGTAALAASIICLTLVGMSVSFVRGPPSRRVEAHNAAALKAPTAAAPSILLAAMAGRARRVVSF